MGMFRKPAPFRIVLNGGERPRGMLGGSLSHYVPPGAQYDYKPPSVFARYKWLTAIFVLLVLGLLLYPALGLKKAPAAPPRAASQPSHQPPASAGEPIYVQPLEPQRR